MAKRQAATENDTDDSGVPRLTALDSSDGNENGSVNQETQCVKSPTSSITTTTSLVGIIVKLLRKGNTRFVAALSKALRSYVQFLSFSINQDKGIKFLQYTLWLASNLYKTGSPGRKGLAKLSTELSFARFVTRLLQVPTAVEAALHKSWTSKSAGYPATFHFLGDVLAWSMIAYYPMEMMAYVHWMVPDWMKEKKEAYNPRTGNVWSAWSCRGWLTFIVAEMVQGALQWKEIREQYGELVQAKKTDSDEQAGKDSDSDKSLVALQQSRHKVVLQFTRNALFVLPAIQYSLPNWDRNPWLPPDVVSFLFWLESAVCLYQASV